MNGGMPNKSDSSVRGIVRKLSMFRAVRSADVEAVKEKSPLLLSERLPVDWFYATYIILFIHGVGHLLPWNMFITAHEYFSKRFACPISKNHSCYGFDDTFENYFSVGAMVAVVVTSALNIYIQSKIHFKYRMFISLTVMLMLFIVTCSFVYVKTNQWVDTFFSVSLLTIIVMNLFSGIFQSSTFGFAGILPQRYTAAVMSGQAWAGLFSSVARIVSSFISSDDRLSALIYFLSGVIIITICFLSLFILLRLEFVQYYMLQTTVRAVKIKQESALRSSVNVKENAHLPFFKIFQEVSIYATSVFLVFFITLSLFPAILSSIKSTVENPDASVWTSDKLFDALVCFLLYNLSDFVGRYLSNWISMPGKWKYLLLVLCLLRAVFVPLFLMCNIHPRSEHFSVILNNDIYPVVLTTALGLSNGFLASLCMVSAPQSVQPDYRETASTIMTWFLTLGLLVGACFSFLFRYLVQIGHP